MLVVIPNGNVSRPGMSGGGYNDEAMAVFREELFGSIIPFIESNYRVKPGAANRAIIDGWGQDRIEPTKLVKHSGTRD
jgi:enterochelin esterase family protein